MSTDQMAEIRASFFLECEELLEKLHDAMNLMAEGRGDAEAVNTLFRAVHSIKGGAGAFGLEALVAFAHGFETVLDQLRSGSGALARDGTRALYRAADLLQDHVRAARDDGAAPPESDAALRELARLTGCAPEEPEPEVEFAPVALDLALTEDDGAAPPGAPGPRHWTVRFTPSAALYASGNEALLVLRALCRLGAATVSCDIPEDLSITDEAAELPRLGWRIDLQADVERSEIEEIFDFVADICTVEIAEAPGLPPVDHPGAGVFHGAIDALQPAQVQMPAGSVREERAAPEAARSAPPAPREPAAGAATRPEAGATVRVDLDRIDRLVNLVGELVINQAMLSQSVSAAGIGNAEVATGLEAFLSLTRDLQDSVMAVRAQPVKPLFQRMARIVREAAAALGKEVRLSTAGEATEVDKTVIERLADPLTHMVRNAISHGIETPDRRSAAGKPREGQVTLCAFHRAGRIVIEVADDGAGIDREAVLGVARSRGLVPADAPLGEAEIDNLLFVPGFSTTERVTALSGRGVGMDVVQSAAAALGGRVSIASEPGRGTVFSISLPLTLAVLDGMVVQAAGQTLVIPLSTIIETAALTPDMVRRIGGSAELLHIRGELVPLLDLGARLGFRAGAAPHRRGIVLLTARDNGARAALIVDTILEQRQVVIKGFGAGFGRMPGVAAATILGDGKIALILDPADLVQTARDTDFALAG